MKNSISISFVIATVSILFCFAQCKKENTRLTITLYDKPLATIQSYAKGKWKLNYAYGGLTGNIKQNYSNTYMEFKFAQIDSFYYTENGTIKINSPIEWRRIKDFFGRVDSTYFMGFHYNGNRPYGYSFRNIQNDTLIIEENAPDGFAYWLTRQ